MSSITIQRDRIETREPVTAVIRGSVKWFDPVRGFGFVYSEQVERDVFLHVNVLRSVGQNSIADGSRVALRVQSGARGPQAVELLSVEGPTPGALRETGATVDVVASPLLPARVKWFDRVRGFGFANLFGQAADVYIHAGILRRAGMADLETGEAISLRATDGANGPFAVEVGPWRL
jgi:CspA family cold shock protein